MRRDTIKRIFQKHGFTFTVGLPWNRGPQLRGTHPDYPFLVELGGGKQHLLHAALLGFLTAENTAKLFEVLSDLFLISFPKQHTAAAQNMARILTEKMPVDERRQLWSGEGCTVTFFLTVSPEKLVRNVYLFQYD